MVEDALMRMLDDLDRLSCRFAEIKDGDGGGCRLCVASSVAMALASKAAALARDAVLLSARLDALDKHEERMN
jgi:hypothetical protein